MKLYPMCLEPCYKTCLWGGGRLRTDFGKSDAPAVTAESWELACHPAGACRVARGEAAGLTLEDLGRIDREAFWGSACREEEFPLLVKLIDAAGDLSVQVHPGEATADRSRGERGKAELWYIVDAAPRSCLYIGLSRRLTREEFLLRARAGTIREVMNRVPAAPGDVYYIRPGTLHAVGAGVVLAELQQNSDTTFRVDDYGRLDRDGRPRPLQLERAAETVELAPLLPAECRANSGVHFPGFTVSELYSGPYFRAFRAEVRTSLTWRCGGGAFWHLLCVEGEGTVRAAGETAALGRGGSCFLPAALEEYELRGRGRFLLCSVQKG